MNCRNPYFIGINSAIEEIAKNIKEIESRNPYFIGINSAMKSGTSSVKVPQTSQSLFYWN